MVDDYRCKSIPAVSLLYIHFLSCFAFFANIMIVKVLSHKEMIRSGVNVTMLLIAVCDFGCSIAELLKLFLWSYSDKYISYPTAYGRLVIYYLAAAFHASSLYLAVGMAFCRVKSLNFANRNNDLWQSPNYAVRVACALCAPVFLITTFILFMNVVKKLDF
ncbi:G-protein coupled receptors family 1 profile domain-containing protein [Caenorhabditis elegans]|uniref:G-protein coupled receptors family 1 profile domain-containing protein n=1 Tax=Caenorhabditis elegans TaxID=6239 RepID=O76666_CAEEL|nr:G-protein coupled receptors family 1 profile domain-containing protein [Caenorhabditis elegans]CCD72486.2 G-protein coupled receptors family 1 profile domain-containing protein [Caenorhabditis elegans]|eukprot:NP_001309508.1 DroMyoSuppressin Receptor related [Caenorhabditis elegans]